RMKKIADSGLLIAFLDRRDTNHNWGTRIFEHESPPFFTAEPIVTGGAAVVGKAGDGFGMGGLGEFGVLVGLSREVAAVRALLFKYRNRPMDLGDACCVRLAELISGSVVYTVDKADFSVYRKNGRQPVPCVFPD